MTPADIVQCWVGFGPRRWFANDDQFDTSIRQGFEALHRAAARRELDGWADTAEGSLALVLLLDQFPRNMYRGSAHAFAADPPARLIARKGNRPQVMTRRSIRPWPTSSTCRSNIRKRSRIRSGPSPSAGLPVTPG